MKIGFITKFPVDFYDTMVQGAKDWNKDHPEVTLIFAQGASGTDDEGEINAIESMVTQGVKAIAITPTSPNVQDELQKAVDAGIVVVLVDNDIPDWDGKVVCRGHGQPGGRQARRRVHEGPGPGWCTDRGSSKAYRARPRSTIVSTGFIDGLGDGFNIVSMLPTDCDQTKGLNAAQDILTANPDVAAIYGACGPPIIGALEAIKTAGKKLVTRRLRRGPGRDQGDPGRHRDWRRSPSSRPRWVRSARDTAFEAANGEDVAPNIDTGTAMVTKDNAADFQ